MKKFKKGSRDKGVEVARGQKLIILSLFITLNFSLLTFHFSLSFAEGLSDIKLSALQSPIKDSARDRWGRDPFIRYEDMILKKEKPQREEMPLDLKVEGIISDGEKALAIINGGFYRRHERVNDFLILAVHRDRVLLEKDGKKFSLGIEKFAVESALGGQKGGKR